MHVQPMPDRDGGFTITELIVVVLIMGIIATMAIPGYQKTIRRAKWDQARDLLTTIYYGEKGYKIAMDTYCTPGTNCNWKDISMENPNFGSSPAVTYSVNSSDASTFSARGTLTGTGSFMSVSELRQWCGGSAGKPEDGCPTWPMP